MDPAATAAGKVGTVVCSGAESTGIGAVVTGSSVGMTSGETVGSIGSAWLAAAVGPAGAESRTIRLSTRPPATQAPIRIPDLQFTMFLVTGDGFGSLLITHHTAPGRDWVGPDRKLDDSKTTKLLDLLEEWFKVTVRGQIPFSRCWGSRPVI